MPAHFLGVNISRLSKVKSEIKNYKNKKGHIIRVSQTAIILKVPIDKLIKKFVEKGHAKK